MDKIEGGLVRHIVPTANGIYMLKPNGVVRYHNGQVEALVSRRFIKGLNMGDIEQLSNGNVLASSNIGLFYFANNKVFFYTLPEYTDKILYNKGKLNIIEFPAEFKSNGFAVINSLLERERGKVWGLGTFNGILHISFTNDTTNPLAFKHQNANVRAPGITFKLQTDNGDVWLSSGDDDVPIYRLHNNEWIEYWPGKMFGVYNKTAEIEETVDGTILIGGVGYLLSFSNNKFEMFSNAQIPLPDQMIKVEIDLFDNIWLGSFGGKYYVVDYHNKRWSTHYDMVYQFESGDTLWFISKDNKVVLNHNDSWWAYSQEDGLMDAPLKLIKTTRGHIWCAGSHNGKAATAYLTDNRWHKQTYSELGWGIDKKSVFEDSKGALWFGSVEFHNGQGGVLKLVYNQFNELYWELFSHENNVPEYNIINGGIAEGENNRMYFGSFNDVQSLDNGDSLMKKSKMQRLGPVQYFKSINNNDFWIGTKRAGLVRFSDTVETRYNIQNGLKSNFIISFDLEDTNKVWAATDDDVSYFTNGQWITNCLPQELNLKNVTSEIHCGNHPGTLWILHIPKEWTLRAINNTEINDEFFSARYIRDTIPPRTNIIEYSEVVDQSGNTYIAWDAIDYWNATEKNELLYSYKLNNSEWTPFEHSTGKSFVGLRRGNYTFSVRAKDKEFNIDPNPPVITFKVLPPVWLRPWFIVLNSVLLLIIIYLWINIIKRNKRLAHNNMELNEQKEEILQQSEELAAQRDTLADKNNKITKAYQQLEVLSTFGQELTNTLSFEAINKMMYNYVRNIINFQAFGIGILDKERNCIVYPAFYEEGKKLEKFEKSLDDKNSLTSWCVNNKETVVIGDFEKKYIKYVPNFNTSVTKIKAYSRLHIPLIIKENPIGMIALNSIDKNAYSPEDVTNLKTLASYISIALDNSTAYNVIQNRNRAINESINYAKSIQSAFMPTQELLNKYLNSFVIFKPKDIVSGDFTWFSPIEKAPEKPLKAFICVADCTGHGVPGALISIVGSNLLNETINIRGIHNPAHILEMVNVSFQLALKQNETNNNDGMEMGLALMEEDHNNGCIKLTFAGAKNPCFIYRSKTAELEILRGSRKSIGGARALGSKQYYENHETILEKGDSFYLISDGITDQHNIKRDRFTRERLMNILGTAGKETIEKQKQILEDELTAFMGNEKQTDDISIIGIKIT